MDSDKVLTSDEFLDIKEVPSRLAVIGGGVIGSELGQAFATFGSKVTIVEMADRLIAAMDKDASVALENATALFANLNNNLTACEPKLDVWMSHGDKVTRLPENFKVTGTTPTCPIAAMSDENRRFYGVQFHPEVTHTKKVGIINEFRGKHLWLRNQMDSRKHYRRCRCSH